MDDNFKKPFNKYKSDRFATRSYEIDNNQMNQLKESIHQGEKYKNSLEHEMELMMSKVEDIQIFIEHNSIMKKMAEENLKKLKILYKDYPFSQHQTNPSGLLSLDYFHKSHEIGKDQMSKQMEWIHERGKHKRILEGQMEIMKSKIEEIQKCIENISTMKKINEEDLKKLDTFNKDFPLSQQDQKNPAKNINPLVVDTPLSHTTVTNSDNNRNANTDKINVLSSDHLHLQNNVPELNNTNDEVCQNYSENTLNTPKNVDNSEMLNNIDVNPTKEKRQVEFSHGDDEVTKKMKTATH